MVSKYLSWIMFPLTLLLIASCGKAHINPSVATLSIDSSSLHISAAGGSRVLAVTMNGNAWAASSNQSWCTISMKSSQSSTAQVSVLIDANDTTIQRSANLVFVMDNSTTVTVQVTQAAGTGTVTQQPTETVYPTYASWISRDQTGMTSNSFTLIKNINLGWNLGNSLEATGSETAWGNPKVTQAFIDSVKKAGINAIRLPCAWDSHIDDRTTCKLNVSWLARVKEVVDYCYANNMYVIINIHWDGGWLENNPIYAKQQSVNAEQKALWEQIAMYFRDYDEHLLFAGTNEVHTDATPTIENFTVQLSYNQTFVNAVRSTGGKNSYRNLIVQAYNTNIDLAASNLIMSTDSVQSRMMAEVHYYDPSDFTLLTADASWATVKWLWGADYAQYGTISTWGQEDWVQSEFQKMKTNFVDKGYPVILGEFSAIRRTSLTANDLVHHLASRAYYHQYVAQQAKNYGLAPFYWDNGSTDDLGSGLFNRNTGTIYDTQSLTGLLQGAASGTYPF